MEKESPGSHAIVIRLTAIFVVFLMVVTIIPMTLAAGTDNYSLVTRSSALQNANIDQVVKLDKNDTFQKAASGQRLSFNIDNTQVSFKLVERSVLSSDFKVIGPDGSENRLGEMAFRYIHFYQGTELNGVKLVSATLSPNLIRFSFELSNGNAYFIQPYDDAERSGYYAIYSTINNEIQQSASVDNLRFDANQIQMNNSSRTASQQVSTLSINSSQNPMMAQQTLMSQLISGEYSYSFGRIILCADYEFYNNHANWHSSIATTFGDVELRYEQQVGISLQLANVVQLDQGTFNTNDPGALLSQFQNYAYNNFARGDREVAHLFTGRTLTGSATGNAIEGGVGMDHFLSDTLHTYASSLSAESVSNTQDMNDWLFGHWMGISFNGDTVFAGTGTWMSSTYSSNALNFDTSNGNRIMTWAHEALDRQRLMNVGPSSTYNQLYVSNMNIYGAKVFLANQEAVVEFNIVNLRNTPVTFSQVFTAARDGEGNNADFGRVNSVTISPHGVYHYIGYFNPGTRTGNWTLWPCYQEQTLFGPYQWLTVHPSIYYALNVWPNTPYTSVFPANDMYLFSQWGIYSFSRYPGPGQTIMAEYTLFNANSGSASTTFNGIFIEARDPNGTCKDFGATYSPSLTQKGISGVVGGGYHGVAFRTVDVSGVWKIAPCYLINGNQWGPWMAPLYIEVGVVKIDWSSAFYGNTNIGLSDLGTKVVLQLPTADGYGASASVGFLIENFLSNMVPPGDNTPGVQIKLAHAYLDNNNADDWDGHNGLYHIKLYVTRESRVSMGTYGSYCGAPYGTSSAFNDSRATFLPSVAEYDGCYGTDCEYYSKLGDTNPDVTQAGENAALEVISFALMEVLGYANPYAAFALGAIGVVENLRNMLNPDPGDYYNQPLGGSSASWADWYTTPIPDRIMNAEDDVTSSYNFLDLYTNHANDEYVFKIWAEVSYAYAEEKYSVCYRATDIDTVTTQPIYLVIDA